jgi:hypothetical protein
VLPGDPLRLREGVLMAYGCSPAPSKDSGVACEAAKAQVKVIETAAHPVLPEIALSLPERIPKCVDLAVDMTASTGSGDAQTHSLTD